MMISKNRQKQSKGFLEQIYTNQNKSSRDPQKKQLQKLHLSTKDTRQKPQFTKTSLHKNRTKFKEETVNLKQQTFPSDQNYIISQSTFSAQQQNKNRLSCLKNQNQNLLFNQATLAAKHQQLTMHTNFNKKKYQKRQLKQIIRKQKVNNIIFTFLQKLKRNNFLRQKYQFNFPKDNTFQKWWYINGIQLPQTIKKIYQTFILILQLTLIIYYTLDFGYQLPQTSGKYSIQIIVFILNIIDLFFNIVSVKVVSGKRLTVIHQIFHDYFTGHFLFDLFFIIVMAFDFIIPSNVFRYFKLSILAKFPLCLERLQSLEIYFIQSSYKEQYWSVIKVFLFNFGYAHILAILLNIMAQISPQNSWLTQKHLVGADWSQIYSWAYYWAGNIMLTVGFGDIVAQNSTQALYIVIIQTFSCIVLAYNINCVGSLIGNIRQQDLQKSKKFKIFRSLAQRNNISDELVLKIGNYIQQSNNMKKKFNIQEQKNFVQSLPKIFKKDYLNQSNKTIFQNIFFFRNLAEKAIQSLAQSIEITITHPQQLIVNQTNYLDLNILKEGQIGFSVKKSGCLMNGTIIQTVKIKEGDDPYLINLGFITFKKLNYQIKSLVYSVNYSLSFEKLIQSMKKSKGDYEYYCFLKDKNKHILDQFQIFNCKNCKTNHTKFQCPNLHYVPIQQHVVNKYIQSYRKQKNSRQKGIRIQYQKIYPLKYAYQFDKCSQFKSNNNYQKKNKVFFIQQLQRLQNYQTVRSVDQIKTRKSQIDPSQLLVLSTATESIKQQFSNFFKRQNEDDLVWTLALDQMYNYKGYFPDDNPCNIDVKFPYDEQTHCMNKKTYINSTRNKLTDLTYKYQNPINKQIYNVSIKKLTSHSIQPQKLSTSFHSSHQILY